MTEGARKKAQRVVVVFFALALAMATVMPRDLSALQTGEGFCQSWLILGQYNQGGGASPGLDAIRQDYLTDGTITETNIIPAVGMVVNTDYTIAASTGFNPGSQPYMVPTVFEYTAPAELVDYSVVFGDYDDVMCYAFTYANNKTGAHLPCYVGVSSDDSIQVIINGIEVGAVSVPRGYGGTNNIQNAWPVTLLPGINLVTVKVFEGGGGFGFRFRFQTTNETGTATQANAISEDDVSFSTSETYSYPALPVISMSRTIGGTYTPGGPPVQITITALATGDGSAQLTENIPTGVTASNVVASAGTANLVGQTITWDVSLTSGTSATLTYDASVGAGVCHEILTFDGSYLTGVWLLNVAGDNQMFQTSDGWENDDVEWAASEDIRSGLTPAGHADYFLCDDSFMIFADGADIWDTADEFHFLYAYVLGDFAIAANVNILPPVTNVWAKAGLMLRANRTPGSPYVLLAVTNGGPGDPATGDHDIAFQWRDDQNGNADWDGDGSSPTYGGATNNGEAWLQLVRTGTLVTANYDDLEGNAIAPWRTHDPPYIDPTEPNLLGLAFTSHASGVQGIATFSGVSIVGNVLVPAVWSATRDIQATSYTAGTPVRVVIDIVHRTDSSPLVIEETVPTGWTVTATTPTATVVAERITWSLPSFTADAQVMYEVVPTPDLAPRTFVGLTRDQIGVETDIGGDSEIMPGGVIIFQQGVYPDPSYDGCYDVHIMMHPSDNPIRNTGNAWVMEEGDYSDDGLSDAKVILIKFELRGISPLATVHGAKLLLYHDHHRAAHDYVPHFVYAARLKKPWNEGTGGGGRLDYDDGRDAEMGEVCWTHVSYDSVPWEVEGARGSTDVDPPEASFYYGGTQGVWIELDVTDMVRDWVRTPYTNYGVKISQDDQVSGPSTRYARGLFAIWSSEYPDDPTLRPMLVIDATEEVSLGVEHWGLYR